jgi:predicted phosphodiesterase
MKIVVITDVHANLPALQAVLKAIYKKGCDAIFHTGDAIAIGPYPAECLDVLLNTPNTLFVMGNHDGWFVDGLPEPQPSWMSDGEVRHQHWTHACINPQLRSVVAQWPYLLEREFEGVKVTFVHYGLRESGREFASIIQHPTVRDLDELFGLHNSALTFYGHRHLFSDVQGRAEYVNPGSLGCHVKAIARYCVVQFQKGQFAIEHCGVPYDDTELFKEFEKRKVPEREFIYQAFFGRRIHG